MLGVVLEVRDATAHAGRILPLRDVLDLPPIPAELLDLARRVRELLPHLVRGGPGAGGPPTGALKLEKPLELTDAGGRRAEAARAGSRELRTAGGCRPAPKRRSPTATGAGLAARRAIGCTSSGGSRRRALARGADGAVAAGRATARRPGLLEEARPARGAALRVAGGLSLPGMRQLLDAGAFVASAEAGDGAAASPDAAAAPAACGRRRGAGGAPAACATLSDFPTCCEQRRPARDPLPDAARRRGAAARRHRQRQDRGLPAGGARPRSRAARRCSLLVPEIGLTGQTVARVRERFAGERVAVLHSGLSAGERCVAYRAIAARRGAPRRRRALGRVRAAADDLGLIVVDEEHDASYKQENEPRYDARTVARWRARRAAPCSCSARRRRASRRSRACAPTPTCRSASTAPSRRRSRSSTCATCHGVLSPQLAQALTATIDAGDKAILFLNRRGFASFLACDHCGHTWDLPPLRRDARAVRRRQRCAAAPAATRGRRRALCPECGSLDLARYGYGTERLEREVAHVCCPVSSCCASTPTSPRRTRVCARSSRASPSPGAKVLVGTQMIAKGHHFPDVTLVGVVNADLTLHFPDFRAEERTFAMLIQVGGRSGRGDRPGRVIVQTLDPEARPIALRRRRRGRARSTPMSSSAGARSATRRRRPRRPRGLSGRQRQGEVGGPASPPSGCAPALGGTRRCSAPGRSAGARPLTPARLVIKTTDIGKTLGVRAVAGERYRDTFARAGRPTRGRTSSRSGCDADEREVPLST